MPPNTDTASWAEIARDGHLLRVAVLCFGIWLHAADAMLMATVIPVAVDQIGGLELIAWTNTLYELGTITAGAVAAIAIHRVGLANFAAGAAGLYVIGCAISALAGDMATVIAGRLAQGLGGGSMVALAYVAVTILFPERLWPRLWAVVSTVWGVSALWGPLIGGLFANVGLWRGAFWAFAAQGVIVLISAKVLLGARSTGTASATPVPYLRLAGFVLAVLAIARAGIEENALIGAGLCMAAVIGLYLLLRRDAASPAPLFPRQVLDWNSTAGLGIAMICCMALASISFTTYGPVLLQHLHGVAPLNTGYLLALESVAWTLAALAFAGAGPRIETWLIRLGPISLGLGLVGFVFLMPAGPVWAILPCALAQGAGFGMCWAFVTRRIVASLSADERTRASATLSSLQRLGYAVGSASCGVVANTAGFATSGSIETSETVAFWVFLVFIPVALVAIVAGWKLSAQERTI